MQHMSGAKNFEFEKNIWSKQLHKLIYCFYTKMNYESSMWYLLSHRTFEFYEQSLHCQVFVQKESNGNKHIKEVL